MESSPFIPEWSGSVFQKWSYNFCLTNAWRVQDKLGDFEDCMAQCALYYIECKKFYEHKINSPAHFMYYYKLWVTGQFHDLSRKDYRHRVTKAAIAVKNEVTEEPDAYLAVALGEASTELKEALSIFFNAPKEMMETIIKDANTDHSGKFFRYILNMLQIKPEKYELQMWSCKKCNTSRKWGEGRPATRTTKQLRCAICSSTTEHVFSSISYKLAYKQEEELKRLLG